MGPLQSALPEDPHERASAVARACAALGASMFAQAVQDEASGGVAQDSSEDALQAVPPCPFPRGPPGLAVRKYSCGPVALPTERWALTSTR